MKDRVKSQVKTTEGTRNFTTFPGKRSQERKKQ